MGALGYMLMPFCNIHCVSKNASTSHSAYFGAFSAVYQVSVVELIKKQTYTKTEAYKLYSRVF